MNRRLRLGNLDPESINSAIDQAILRTDEEALEPLHLALRSAISNMVKDAFKPNDDGVYDTDEIERQL